MAGAGRTRRSLELLTGPEQPCRREAGVRLIVLGVDGAAGGDDAAERGGAIECDVEVTGDQPGQDRVGEDCLTSSGPGGSATPATAASTGARRWPTS